jgi:hypothetical protein
MSVAAFVGSTAEPCQAHEDSVYRYTDERRGRARARYPSARSAGYTELLVSDEIRLLGVNAAPHLSAREIIEAMLPAS